jgi:hypothetical protein
MPYIYPPVSSSLASFPPIWQTASILPNDTNAKSKWAAVQPTLPNIPTKVRTFHWRHFFSHTFLHVQGTPMGDFTSVSYPTTDPDCWWTYRQCTTPKLQGLSSDIANVPEVCDMLLYRFFDQLVIRNSRLLWDMVSTTVPTAHIMPSTIF